ncbi:hypothetical protein FKM82_011028 [Ascaphus truei]
MACGATLKRTMDFDPLLSPSASPKRRRCAPLSPGPSPQKYLRMEPSPFGEVSSRLTAEQILYNIKQEYKRMQKRRHLENHFQPTDPCCSTGGHPHAFLTSGPTLPGSSIGCPGKQNLRRSITGDNGSISSLYNCIAIDVYC